jgi:hypothetical protein
MHRGGAWRVLDWIYWQLIYTQLRTTGNRALSLIYTLHSSPLCMHQGSRSSLVVSWQQIYYSLSVTSDHTWSFLVTAEFLSCNYFASANAENCSVQFQAHILAGWHPETLSNLLPELSSISHVADETFCHYLFSLTIWLCYWLVFFFTCYPVMVSTATHCLLQEQYDSCLNHSKSH